MLQRFPSNDKKRDRELVQHYRNTFSSPSGKIVLCHMIAELGFFDQVTETEADKTLADYAKRILTLCGIFLPENIESVMEYLFKVPVQLEKEQE